MGDDDYEVQVENLRTQIESAREQLLSSSNFESAGALAAPYSSMDERRELKGHFGKVYAMHWGGGESHFIISASQDGKLIVWNAHTTNKLEAIHLRSSWVMTCAFEQQENRIVACGGLDNICSIYKLDYAPGVAPKKDPIKELSGHDGYLSCCRFMEPDKIVTSSGDSTCRYWDVEANRTLLTFKEHTGDVMTVSPSPNDPNVFVSGSCDTYAKVWDIRERDSVGSTYDENTWRSKNTHKGHESDINATAFFPDGMAFGTGSDDASCRLFDLRCYQQINSYTKNNIVCGITSVDFSSSGRVLFGGYDDYNCIGWDTVKAPDAADESTHVFKQAHDNRVSCLGVQSEGKALATGSWNYLVKVYA